MPERPGRGWMLGLALICATTLALQFRHIDRTVPYPRYVDEAFITGPAHRTLTTGNWHPYTFNYPSLPKYLTAAGMAAGFIRGAAKLEFSEIYRLGNVGYPYYEQRRPMQTARQVFAVLATIAVIATAAAAWAAFRVPSAVGLAPLLLVMSPLFFSLSWSYLNVDIVGTCFVMLTVAVCLAGTRAPSISQSALLPGALAGLATGSKYTLAVVILPVFVAIGLYVTAGRRLLACVLAIAAMVAAFILAVPYSILDVPGFLNGVASEAFHYASGHRGFQGEPGIPQLLYYSRHLLSEFGPVGLTIAAGGLVAFALFDWRRALVLAAFPAALLWLLISQRVHFVRNVLALQPFVAMFCAYGISRLFVHIVPRVRQRLDTSGRWRTTLPAAVAAVLVLLAAPAWHIPALVGGVSESRNDAVPWILERVPPAWTIVIPTQLGFDPRPLQAQRRKVETLDFAELQNAARLRALLDEGQGAAVILAPRWGFDPLFEGGEPAKAFNDISRRWRVLKTFGTHDVLVNFSYSVPWGDPAFSVAVLR